MKITCAWTVITLAHSNAALVESTVALCERHGRPVATWQQAHERFGL
ncbi:3-keto-5-aminohexanoate cleavage protein [Vreelandella nigrificans]|nr:3-keto-5-aminohexanoate cleavage protein [Halomonas nigrificans]